MNDENSDNMKINAYFTEKDYRDFESRGISLNEIEAQIDKFNRGTRPVKLNRAATINDGIIRFGKDALDNYRQQFQAAEADGRITKFVPASGAASRMFKALLSVLNEENRPVWNELIAAADRGHSLYKQVRHFITHLPRFAFYDDLKTVFAQTGSELDDLIKKGDYRKIITAVLFQDGLNYANMPKGLIKFHQYPQGSRTPFEEHLVEAIAYAKDRRGVARLHFTIPIDENLQQLIRSHIDSACRRFEKEGLDFEISYSTQKPSTDTIAVDLDNRPFRNPDGEILFRPGGHGALLENLNDLKGDIVFIKNIDNVAPDRLKSDTILYKKALGGYLVSLQKKIFSYLETLSGGSVDDQSWREMVTFATEKLSLNLPKEIKSANRDRQARYLFEKLNRPLRVCGMVKNEGEPGGGPFWVEDDSGNISLQVVETAQIETSDILQQQILASATHFSPVDFVCAMRNFRSQPFDLHNFRDPESGFIAIKSQNGRELKALELPGLWNGGMAGWNSVFVEVPISTFTPVKTVFDLLRPQHQPEA